MTVGIALNKHPAKPRCQPNGDRLKSPVQGHECAPPLGLSSRGQHGHARDHPRIHAKKETCKNHENQRQRCRLHHGGNGHGHDGQQQHPLKHFSLAHPVAQATNPTCRQQSHGSATQIDIGDFVQCEHLIGLGVNGDVRDDGEARKHHRSRHPQGSAVIRVRPHLLHRKRDLLPLRFGDMRIQSRQAHHGHHTHDRAHQGNRKKRTVPTTHIGQKQATGHAHHGRHGKRCHHKTCCPPPPLKRNHVPNHRLRHGRQDAAKSACRHTSGH